jgi:hypothetical protein
MRRVLERIIIESVKGAYIIFSMLLLTACAEPVRIAEKEMVRVTNDSEDIRKIIFAEGNQQMLARRGRSSAEWKAIIRYENIEGQEPPRRRAFLKTIESAPGFDLVAPSDAIIIQTMTNCRCTFKEQYFNAMDKIQITSGPFKGRMGWVCDDRVRRIQMWP